MLLLRRAGWRRKPVSRRSFERLARTGLGLAIHLSKSAPKGLGAVIRNGSGGQVGLQMCTGAHPRFAMHLSEETGPP